MEGDMIYSWGAEEEMFTNLSLSSLGTVILSCDHCQIYDSLVFKNI